MLLLTIDFLVRILPGSYDFIYGTWGWVNYPVTRITTGHDLRAESPEGPNNLNSHHGSQWQATVPAQVCQASG